ncbi:MAG: alpha/beta hydrolase [Ruminococcaceae bacterium]|nr:alpha/beta hydrolase [Oscillospiraceae bacterium]
MSILHNIYSIENGDSFVSASGVAGIFYQSWTPSDPDKIKGIFQIVHGMAEHSDRYEEFAKFLTTIGFAVFATDHVGHGRSIKTEDDLGYFGEKDGWKAFVEDAHTVTLRAKKEFPGVPVVLFGHSMGSFVVRSYISQYADDIDATIICGTSGPNPASGMGIFLANTIAKIKGSKHKSKLINSIAFSAYNKRCASKDDNGFGWLSTDKEVVKKYNADPLCGFLFTAKGFTDLFGVLDSVSKKDCFVNTPKNLPIYLISGKEDPVGSYGTGVEKVYKEYVNTGHNKVTIKLYDRMRHEILNEFGKEEVMVNIAQWCQKILTI